MIQLGVTGGIGSGKSTVCKVLEHMGIPVYYADEEAKTILYSTKVKQQVIALLGKQIIDSHGLPDRKKISALVFADKKKLALLNSIIHPAVAAHYKHWLKSKAAHKLVAKEAAILFESGSYKQMNKILMVYAPRELRIKRVMERNQLDRKEILSRMKSQLSEKEKIAKSDFVIYNDEKKLVLPQVLKLLKHLKYNPAKD